MANKEKDYTVIPPRIEIIIRKSAKGELTFGVVTDEVGASLDEMVGMLEQIKFSLIQKDYEKRNAPEMVQVELTEEDFKLDTNGILEKKGLKVGDTVPIPKAMLEMRNANIEMVKGE